MGFTFSQSEVLCRLQDVGFTGSVLVTCKFTGSITSATDAF